MKKTDEKSTVAMDATGAEATRHPAEIEADRLRNELCEERIKVNVLSRRCIRLGEALDAAIQAEDDRIEKGVFDIINSNSANREALLVEGKRRIASQKKAVAEYEKACKRNAISLACSTVIAFGAIIFGFAGLVHAALAATIAGIAITAFGWALNDCVYLLRRCKQ